MSSHDGSLLSTFASAAICSEIIANTFFHSEPRVYPFNLASEPRMFPICEATCKVAPPSIPIRRVIPLIKLPL